MTLDQAKPGQTFRVEILDGRPELLQRLTELGLLEGEEIVVLSVAPLGDPLEIQVGYSRLSLRKSEAAGIHIHPL
jgi:ferrous iron transport protein A